MTQLEVEYQFNDFSGNWKRGVDVPGHGAQRGLSGSLKRGEWVAVIGDNGMGKSTLLSAMAGLTPFSHGLLSYDSKKFIVGAPFERYLASMVYVGQASSYPDNIEFDHLARLYFRNRGSIANSTAIRKQLAGAFEYIGIDYSKRNSISTRIMEFILAISVVPSILILDEIGPEFKKAKLSVNPYRLIKQQCPDAIVFVVDHDRKKAIEQCQYLIYLGDPIAHDTIHSGQESQPIFRALRSLNISELDRISGDQVELENYVTGQDALKIENDEIVGSLLRAAITASRRFPQMQTNDAYKRITKSFEFLDSNSIDYSKLSGGQKVVFSAIVQKLLFPNSYPAKDVLGHLSTSTRRTLKCCLEFIADGSTS